VLYYVFVSFVCFCSRKANGLNQVSSMTDELQCDKTENCKVASNVSFSFSFVLFVSFVVS